MLKFSKMLIKLKRHLTALALLSAIDLTSSAPKTWPYMKTYDIWETNATVDRPRVVYSSHSDIVDTNLLDGQKSMSERRRKAKGELNVVEMRNFFKRKLSGLRTHKSRIRE